jgi:uncharacterized protein (TIGR02145 family)
MTRKIAFLGLIVLLSIITVKAQDYQISFEAGGEAQYIETVNVQNLTQGTSLSINGTDVLNLVGTVSIESLTEQPSIMNIYPNPITTNTKLYFTAQHNDFYNLKVFNIKGKCIASLNINLQAGTHSFNLSDFSSGIYTLNIQSATENQSIKFVSTNASSFYNRLTYNTLVSTKVQKNTKSSKNIVQMQYNEGDLLLFEGVSNNYRTNYTLIPTESTIVTLMFYDCTDGDNQHYSTVTIGDQIWMAENLKTTKYNDGTNIELGPVAFFWSEVSYGIYQWYMYDQTTYGDTYGALYNWHAVNTGNLCPDGWHVPTDEEWNALRDYIGSHGHSGAEGTALKTTFGWDNDGNGTNDYGFSALPGGSLGYAGEFNPVGRVGFWWSSNSAYDSFYTHWILIYGATDFRDVVTEYYFFGNSIRCLRDD